MSATSVFQVKFDIEFTRQAGNFFFNRIVKDKLNYWAKTNVLYFCQPLQPVRKRWKPFQIKVSCQDVANRKQDILV